MTHHPCRQDCPRRSGECHSMCPEYKEFEADRNAEYARRKIQIEADCAIYDSMGRQQIRRYKNRKEWRRK